MKTIQRITALQARRNLGQILEEVYYRGSYYIIERAGRPMAAMVPVEHLAKGKKQHPAPFPRPEKQRMRSEKPAQKPHRR